MPDQKLIYILFQSQIFPFMPCPSTGSQIVCAGPNFLCQTKLYLYIVPDPNFLCQTKRWFVFRKFHFSVGTKVFGVALNTNQFLVLQKIFGLAQNILGLLEGQGIGKYSFFGTAQTIWSCTKCNSNLIFGLTPKNLTK